MLTQSSVIHLTIGLKKKRSIIQFIHSFQNRTLTQKCYQNLTQKCYQKQLNFCKLCLSEKFYITKSLNEPNLLNKKFELVNTCRHQSKLLLKILVAIKVNCYWKVLKESIQWEKWYNGLISCFWYVSSSSFDVSVRGNRFCRILTYSPFRSSILFLLLVYTISFSKSFKLVYSLMGR